jgi:hypothetical protein
MTASRKTTSARSRTAAAKTTSAKATNGKPATSTRASRKPAASKTAKPAAAKKLSTDSDVIPTDPAELRKLIKIARDRRWRAGRRGDVELVQAMNAKLATLTAAAK